VEAKGSCRRERSATKRIFRDPMRSHDGHGNTITRSDRTERQKVTQHRKAEPLTRRKIVER